MVMKRLQRQYWMQGGGDEVYISPAPDAGGFAVWFVNSLSLDLRQKSFFYIAVVRSSDYRPIVY